MSMDPSGGRPVTEPVEGLRERKRRLTRQRIAEAGLRLFLEKGYEATTLDEIALAADISRRTVFHYFDSKDAILMGWQSGAEDVLRSALAEASARHPPRVAVRVALLGMVSHYDSREAIALDRLLRSTEALRARKQAGYERQERALFGMLVERWPDPGENLRLRLVAMVAIGVLRIAAETWSTEGGHRPLQDYLREAFAAL